MITKIEWKMMNKLDLDRSVVAPDDFVNWPNNAVSEIPVVMLFSNRY